MPPGDTDAWYVYTVVDPSTCTGGANTPAAGEILFYSLGGGFTLGNGSAGFRARRRQGRLDVQFAIQFGSTTTYGSGEFNLVAKSGPLLNYDPNNPIPKIAFYAGIVPAGALHSGTIYQGFLLVVNTSATTSTLRIMMGGSSTGATPTSPFTWATSDYMFANTVLSASET